MSESRATAVQALIDEMESCALQFERFMRLAVSEAKRQRFDSEESFRNKANEQAVMIVARSRKLAALLLREGPPHEDYEAALAVLPDSLERPLAARIGIVLASLKRESHIGCELRRELDSGIERDAKAIEKQWPAAAAFLRSHAHIEDGV